MTDATSDVLIVAQRAARAAAQVLLRHFGRAEVREKGGSQNVVTQADLESEALITGMVLEAFPDHALLREETAFEGDMEADHLWVIDPLDATNNFAHGIPHFCLSIAYAQRGTPRVGVVYDPLRDEMFWACRGEGAYLNGRPIRVSQPNGLNQTIVATGFYYNRGPEMERTLDAIRTLFRANIRGLRRMGSAALDMSWVACGRFGGFFEYELAPWDYAAGWLIVQEAGGICLDRGGQPLALHSGSLIAVCPAIEQEFVRLVAWPPTAQEP
jgi:myo-inositol-1(or 4)-monophosphatase